MRTHLLIAEIDCKRRGFTSIPVPDNVTICGLPFASSVTERFPVARPLCTGVNFTWI